MRSLLTLTLGLGLAAGAAGLATAGTISSGGGRIYGDQLNPWFLENTKTVSYCVEADEANFGVPLEQAASLIDSAIAEWQRAFANDAASPGYGAGELAPYSQIRIATQDFRREECKATTMLRFELGLLSDAQQQHDLADPTQYVATTIRTAYDLKTLTGTGYIYVSPQSGPLKPASPLIDAQRWTYCDGCLLRRVVLHELGHVFGLPHFGASSWYLMHAQHPETISQTATMPKTAADWVRYKAALQSVTIFGFAGPYVDKSGCNSDLDFPPEGRNAYLGVPAGWVCHETEILGAPKDGVGPTINFYASPSKDVPLQLVGTVSAYSKTGFEAHTPIIVQLTAEQTVFTKLPTAKTYSGYLDGPGIYDEKTFTGTYESADHQVKRPVRGTLMPENQVRLEGIADGQFLDL